MWAARAAATLLAAALATTGSAENRRASFTVTLRVLATRSSSRVVGTPTSFVGVAGATALPCGAPGSAACTSAAAAHASGTVGHRPVYVTTLTDGAPTAIVER